MIEVTDIESNLWLGVELGLAAALLSISKLRLEDIKVDDLKQ